MTPESLPQTATPGTAPGVNPGAPQLASETWVSTAAPHISEAQRLFWLIRRELWENHAIYRAPLIVAALIVLGFFYSTLHIPADLIIGDPSHGHGAHVDTLQVYNLAAALIMGTTFLVGVFYSLDALYAERRDRSILFWKSLPISDLTTVLSKAAIPLVLLPLLTFVITIATQSLMLLLHLAVFHLRGLDTTTLHSQLPLTQNALMLLYRLLAIHALWYAPLWCWFLLVSAWARRTPLLWATLPPFALGVLEVITLHTGHVFQFLMYRVHGPQGSDASSAGMSISQQMPLSPTHFLTNPGLWEGLALAAVFLAAATQLRRYRNPL